MAKSGCGTVEHVRMIVWLPRPQSVMVSALDDCDSIDLDVDKLSDDVGNATLPLIRFAWLSNSCPRTASLRAVSKGI